MKKKTRNILAIIICLTIIAITGVGISNISAAGDSVTKYGNLKVIGTNLCDKNGNPVQLKGMSSHGLQWYGDYINKGSLTELRDKWGANIIRAAMYVDEGGYLNNSATMKQKVIDTVDTATSLGMYVIIDWHILNPGDPNVSVDSAKTFFKEMATKYANSENVIYEICNEPNGVDWSAVKKYANQVIPVIRGVDADSVIICGTPTWSQDVDTASADKLDYKNIMYSLHFYSGTHKQSLRDKASKAISNGAAVFATEWGTSEASGNGGPYLDEAQTWIDFLSKNNISWCNWSLCDKSEISAALAPGASKTGGWSDSNLSESGKFVKTNMLKGSSTSSTQPTTSNNTSTTKPTSSSTSTTKPTSTAQPSKTTQPTSNPTVKPTSTTLGKTSCTYKVNGDWTNGANVEVIIKNNGSSDINGWEITWSFPGNQKIINLWKGKYTQSRKNISVKNESYNKVIPKNGQVDFGFNISYSGTNKNPSNFKIK